MASRRSTMMMFAMRMWMYMCMMCRAFHTCLSAY